MEMRRGPIEPVERILTDRRIGLRLLEIVEERMHDDRPLRLAVLHADAEETAWELGKAAQERFEPDELEFMLAATNSRSAF